MQRAAAERQRAACITQAAVRRNRDRAGVDRRAASIVAGAAQGQRAAALLDQPAGAASQRVVVDRAGEGRRGGRSHRQVVVAEADARSGHAPKVLDRPAGAGGRDTEFCADSREVDLARRGDAAGKQQRQHAGVDRRGPGIGVGAGQPQRAAAGLGKAARAADNAVLRKSRAGRHVEGAAAVVQRRRARHRQRCRHMQRAAVERQCAVGITQIAVRPNRQRAGVDRRAAGIGIGAGQGQRAAALLDQPAAAAVGGDHAGEGRRTGRSYRQAGVAEADGGSGYPLKVLDRLAAGAARDIERGPRGREVDARRDDAADAGKRQRAGVDRRDAAIGIGAAEHQRAVTDLGQTARAADAAVLRKGRAGRHVEGAAPRIQRRLAQHRDVRRRLQRAAAEGQRTAGITQAAVRRNRDRAAVDRRAARIDVGARQRPRAGPHLYDRSGVDSTATNSAAETRRQVVAAYGELVRVKIHLPIGASAGDGANTGVRMNYELARRINERQFGLSAGV